MSYSRIQVIAVEMFAACILNFVEVGCLWDEAKTDLDVRGDGNFSSGCSVCTPGTC